MCWDLIWDARNCTSHQATCTWQDARLGTGTTGLLQPNARVLMYWDLVKSLGAAQLGAHVAFIAPGAQGPWHLVVGHGVLIGPAHGWPHLQFKA